MCYNISLRYTEAWPTHSLKEEVCLDSVALLPQSSREYYRRRAWRRSPGNPCVRIMLRGKNVQKQKPNGIRIIFCCNPNGINLVVERHTITFESSCHSLNHTATWKILMSVNRTFISALKRLKVRFSSSTIEFCSIPHTSAIQLTQYPRRTTKQDICIVSLWQSATFSSRSPHSEWYPMYYDYVNPKEKKKGTAL